MNSTPDRTISLSPGAALRIDDACGAVIHVVRGRIWLTISDGPGDVVLGAGATFRIRHVGRVVIESWSSRESTDSVLIQIKRCGATNQQTLASTMRRSTATRFDAP